MSRVERRILRGNPIKPLRKRTARLGQAFPSIGRRRYVRGRRQRSLVDRLARHGDDIVVLRALDGITRRTIEWRPLIAGTLPENAAQAQENKDGQSQEDNSVNIHVVSLSGLCRQRRSAVEPFLSQGKPGAKCPSRLHHRLRSRGCRHEILPGQGAFARKVKCSWKCSAFWPRGEIRSCPEIARIQSFKKPGDLRFAPDVLPGRSRRARSRLSIAAIPPSCLWGKA